MYVVSYLHIGRERKNVKARRTMMGFCSSLSVVGYALASQFFLLHVVLLLWTLLVRVTEHIDICYLGRRDSLGYTLAMCVVYMRPV
jgi:hypothetical protein